MTSAQTTRRLRAVVTSLLLATLAGGGPRAWAQDEIRVEATHAGFRPKAVNLRKGEGARLILTTADGEHCFAVDALRIEKRIVPGKATTLDLTVDRAGTFTFYCCLEPEREAMRGRLVVTE
jgi:plastocyanin